MSYSEHVGEIQLRLAMALINPELGRRFKSVFSRLGISYAQAFYDREPILEALEANTLDAVFIEITGSEEMRDFVRRLISSFPRVAICLVGSDAELSLFFQTAFERKRLYRLATDQSDLDLQTDAEIALGKIAREAAASTLLSGQTRSEADSMNNTSATIFALAVVIAGFCLSFADALPGGLTGAQGFVIGFFLSFVGLILFRLWLQSVRKVDVEAVVTEEGVSYEFHNVRLKDVAIVKRAIREEMK